MGIPSREECLLLLRRYGADDVLVLHSLAVTDVAEYLSRRMVSGADGRSPDTALVVAASLLHDIGKGNVARSRYGERDHAEVSREVLLAEGLPASVADAAGRHQITSLPVTLTDQLVWYADKSTGFRYIGLEARLNDLVTRYGSLKQVVDQIGPAARELEKALLRDAGLAGLSARDIRGLMARRNAGALSIAVGTTYDYGVDIATMFLHASEIGYGSVSLAGGNVPHSGYDTAQGRARLLKLSSETGVAISSVHAPFAFDMASADESQRQRAIGGCIMACEAASLLGAPVVVVHPHGAFRDGLPGSVTRSMASIKQILESCPKDVTVAVENLPPEGTEVVLRHIFDAFPEERVGFCYDSSHHRLRTQGFNYLGEFGSRLAAVHISDNRGLLDDHQIPGEGTTCWKDFASAFGRTGYSGPFLLEVETRESCHKESRQFLKTAYNRAEWLLALSDRAGQLR